MKISVEVVPFTLSQVLTLEKVSNVRIQKTLKLILFSKAPKSTFTWMRKKSNGQLIEETISFAQYYHEYDSPLSI